MGLITAIHDHLTKRKMERVFRKRQDPYRYTASAYEQERFETMVAALGDGRFDSVLEVGCGEGRFTERLLERAQHVTALDISPTVIERCKANLAAQASRVTVICANARDWIRDNQDQRFSLVVLSEVLYYLGDGRSKGQLWEKPFLHFLQDVVNSLPPSGRLLLAHGFGNQEEKGLREGYSHRLLEMNLMPVRRAISGERPHDKGGMRCLIDLMEKRA